jgi:hypothetical protein
MARLLILALFLSTGCSLHSSRSFLTEMEHDDSRFFDPRSDFPVVAGDAEYGHTLEDYRSRVPASKEDQEADRINRALRAELRGLEGRQSADSLELYQQHAHRFSTVSEKIYFLRLPRSERREYLQSRGFLDHRSRPEALVTQERQPQRRPARKSAEVGLGMSKDDVMNSLGEPVRVEVAGNPRNENERWLYQFNGATKYIYFEAGQVHGWE